LNFLLINSNENDAFASVYFNDKLRVVRASEFKSDEIPKAGRSPDKLINCLAALRENFDFGIIDAISVTTGPGSFTGIRVGLSFAKGISAATGKPIIPINSFDLQFERIQDKSIENKYCILIAAKPPEYYYAIYENNNQSKTGSGTIEEIASICAENTILVANFDNESVIKHPYFAVLDLNNSTLKEHNAMLALSQRYFSEGRLFPPERVEPVYIKEFIIKS